MNNDKHTFKYQPMLASSVIVWSWTALVLMAGIILWLETLKFKWWLLVIAALFIVLVAIQISLRRVTINHNLIIFSTVLNHSWLVIPRDQLELIVPIRGGLKVQIDGNQYRFLMLKKARNQLIDLATSR
ncbi:EbsA family protein [Lactiplantibacillus plantarum]|uniref:EbsA family protein n=1 Tax=Lactiplantibacillus plantarum TaxID=1590 RepID=UPI0005FAD8B5|nr:EbsA family protein [Lactiplantibacillus plantarum]MCG0570141.1 pore-forming protein [Lactiplantibacillus plantarum]MCG0673354.1 pore-forming protein [Lactiplantibacillus plantarum]MCG0809276.1 pore-forming protein [Lactiplantibacillus plantarum]MCG0862051.1 pore-forming protein [Lactiplantibacillus plantarum]MCW6147418.1 EbsA family protein [Lactiplantibacillus plantarum]